MFFWKNTKKGGRLEAHREELTAMAKSLLGATDAVFDEASQLEQALVGTFLFGMISAHGMLHKLSQADVHALSLIVFTDVLHYTPETASAATQECINAAAPGYHDTMNAILHRGIDGHRQYLSKDISGLGQNMNSILNHFRTSNLR